MPSEPARFGDLLRGYRIRRGFSQQYLAEKARISVEAVGSLERGIRRAPNRSTFTLLVAALELDEAELVALEAAATLGRARPRGTTARQHNLPAQFSTFVGRDNEVAKIGQLVKDHRLVSIVGAGGIGKTQIALHAAESLLDGFEGVWFVDLAAFNDASLVPIAVLSALNVPESARHKPIDTTIAYLKNKRALLIFDNCEHLIDDAARTADAILQHCALVHILATSREVLGVGGERVVRVPPLSVPSPETVKMLTVDEALRYGSVALFVDRATDADSRFQFTETLVPTIVEICRRLDGIALAIELAAARVNIMSATALVHSLNDRFLVLTAGKRTAPPRQRTIRALLDWSYELLDEREQRLLRKLSVFAGGFTLELARAQSAQDEPIDETEVLYLLGSLVDKSLLQYESLYDTTRYRLLEPTREYAGVKLRDHEESSSAARAHALAILALVDRLSLFHFISDRVWKTQVQPEIENWRAALQWAFGPQGDLIIGQRLAGELNSVWWSQLAAEGWRWVRHALDTCDDTTPPEIRAKLELRYATMSVPLGRAQTGEVLLASKHALRLFEEAGDPLGAAFAQAFTGELLALNGRTAEAEGLLRRALSVAETIGARRLIAMVTYDLGAARAIAGDVDTARQLIGEAFEMYKAGGGISHEKAILQHFLAELEFQAGNPEAALQLSLESAESFRKWNRNFNLCVSLSNAAAYTVALARFDEARDYAREAVILAADGGFDQQSAWASQHLAAIAALRPHDNDGDCSIDLRRAARALGFVDERFTELENVRQYTEQQEYDKVLRLLHRELGAELDELMSEGTHWSAEHALEELLKV